LRQLFDTAKDGLVLRVHVQPGAGKEAVVGTYADALKVQVAASPVSGRANEAVLSLLSRMLDLERSHLEITSGATSRIKRVKISEMEPEDLEKRLRVLVSEAGSDARARQRRR